MGRAEEMIGEIECGRGRQLECIEGRVNKVMILSEHSSMGEEGKGEWERKRWGSE